MQEADDGLPLEFLNLPSFESAVDVTSSPVSQCFVCHPKRVAQSETKGRLQETLQNWHHQNRHAAAPRTPDDRLMPRSMRTPPKVPTTSPTACHAEPTPTGEHAALFATYSSMGVVDLGATKTVIGSNLVKGLLEGLSPVARKSVRRCPCHITSRFGNQGTLQSEYALAIPIHGLWLKIAIVPGSTPFLLSNTLLRAIGAVIDTDKKTIFAAKIGKTIPIQRTSKGLFLLDLNNLVDTTVSLQAAETHQVSEVMQKPPMTECTEPEVTTELQSSGNHTTCPMPCHTHVNKKVQVHYQDQSTSIQDSSSCNNEHEETSSIPKHEDDMPEPVDTRSSKPARFARSFRFPKSLSNDKPQPSPETDPSSWRDSQTRLQSPESQPTGGDNGRFWSDAYRQEVQRDVEASPRLDPVVHGKVREVRKGESPEVSLLHTADGGTGRVGRLQGDCEQRATNGHRLNDGKGEAHAQENDDASPHRHRVSVGHHGGGLRDLHGRTRPGNECRHTDSPTGRCLTAGTPSAECRDHAVADRGSSGESPDTNRATVDECPSWNHALMAGDHDAIDVEGDLIAPETNTERKMFNKWLHQITREFNSCGDVSGKLSPAIDVLEVFCGPNSQLTHQCQQMGHRAMRFGLAEGDLQTVEGRQRLFHVIQTHRPRHIWFSPKCGPWSGWSNLNGSKSIESWDALQQSRLQHIDQIALGIVLMRHPRANGRHFHWEQPRTSHVFKLPYVQEVRQRLLALDVDLCTAGDLRDPNTQMHMRKSLTIMTSSPGMYHDLEGLKCHGQHQHQQVSGSCQVNGSTMLRTTFTENYPRKFARRLAKSLCRLRVPREMPYLLQQEECLWTWTLANESDRGERASKRPRMSPQASLKISRAREVDQLPWGKRCKLTSKTPPIDATKVWEEVFQGLQQIAPRVGKIEVQDSQIISQVKTLMGNKNIQRIIVCRGTNRTIAPPKNLMKGEAPYRRSVFTERNSGKIKADDMWEAWENLPNRQLIRASHPCRLNMTVFACNPEVPKADSASRPDVTEQTAPNSNATPVVETIPATEPKHSEATDTESPNPDSTLTESQQADLKSPTQGTLFKSLTKEEQLALIRAHKNLGHPHAEKFSSIIRQQGFRPEVARAALEMRCSVCQTQRAPKPGTPGTLRDELDFNDRIHVDGFTWTNSQEKGFHVYHFVDSATSFQVACVSPSRAADAFLECFVQYWLMWAGPPHEMIVDAGTELNSEEVTNFVQANNIRLSTISTEAHFQNGRAERHGLILQNMLTKYEKEHAIHTYHDLKQGLWWCVQAKNAYSIRKGYSPEVLVLGKQMRLPGSICSDELLPAHLLADAESAQGVQFRLQLARRESARKAFVQTDHYQAMRRAILRKSQGIIRKYQPGEWVMVWRQGKGAYPDQWTGPMKVVVHENAQTVWTTMAAKLYRAAPEHIRPVSAMEAKGIVILPNAPSVSTIAQQIPHHMNSIHDNIIHLNPPPDVTLPPATSHNPTTNNTPITNPETHHGSEHQSEIQPDAEPGVPGSHPSTVDSPSSIHTQPQSIHDTSVPVLNPEHDMAQEQLAQNTPLPTDIQDDDLVCEGLHCVDTDPESLEMRSDQAWTCSFYITDQDVENWKREDEPGEFGFLATAAKRQRAEVKLATLSSEEKAEFQKAKEKEIQNSLQTGTISKIVRDQVPPDQILRCRWILTWKPIDQQEKEQLKRTKNVKAKARLVILGYLDPKIAEVPRDSPTLGRHSKMLLLQLIASKGWNLQSFDIKAAFLQGKPQQDRILAIEPVAEIIKMMNLSPHEICKLEKGAYGLVDAPFMWYQAILEELQKLEFEQSPFDPCLFVLRDPKTGAPDGILGLHVDDGLCAGNERFQKKLALLEKKYPFGTKRIGQFTFTGIDMQQTPNSTIHLSQSKYIRAIEPIKINPERPKTT